jgi:hypothetical protein
LTNTAYFSGHAVAHSLWVLAAWAIGGLAGLTATTATAESPSAMPDNQATSVSNP